MIENEYIDNWGRIRKTKPEVEARIRQALGEIKTKPEAPVEALRIWWPGDLRDGTWRRVGLNVALYGLRSERNWGIGDFGDLAAFGLWAREALGVELIGLNPLHAIPNRYPYNISPYLPTSAYFRNPIYLDVESTGEFGGCEAARALWNSPVVQAEVARLRQTEFVEYEPVWALKQKFLRLLYRSLEGERRFRFNDWFERPEQARLRAFACFCALDEVIHEQNPDTWVWTDWPVEYRDPGSDSVRQFAAEHEELIRMFAYQQWLVDEQLAAVQEQLRDAGMEVGLYHDLALATDRYGFDVWFEREGFVSDCRVGSPPDGFSPDGQDWSFPPPRASYWESTGYAGFRELIRANARHGGALRFDHVMRFYRLYFIPEGFSAQDGAYVRYPAPALLRVIAEESRRQGFLVIGEDLGTVPGELRSLLDEFGVLGYRLLIFEKDGERFRRPEEYPALAVASVTTHDLPTLFGFPRGKDIEARRAAGLIREEDAIQQMSERLADQEAWNLALGLTKNPADPEELSLAAIEYLARTPSAILMLNLEEVTGEENQQNLPGSTAEYPNWRRKAKVRIEELRGDSTVRQRVVAIEKVMEKERRIAGSR